MRRVVLGVLVSLGACGDDELVTHVDPPDAAAPADAAPLFTAPTTIEGEPGSLFGSRIAISGDTLVVAAPASVSRAVHVLRLTDAGWTEEAVLTASQPVDEWFGVDVAIDADTIAIGSERPAGGQPGMLWPAGVVYVFVRAGATWTEQARLQPSDTAPNDRFGRRVAIDGDTIAATNITAAYVFTRTGPTWTERARVTGDDSAFGTSIAVDDDTVLVGARYEDNGCGLCEHGGGYVFTPDGATWTRQAKLVSSHPVGLSGFGAFVAISSDTVVLGGHGSDEEPGSSALAVFVREADTWSEQQVLVAPDSFSGAALDEDFLVVSEWSPRVYGYERSGTTWTSLGGVNSPAPDVIVSPVLSADHLAVAAPAQGAVYVYDR